MFKRTALLLIAAPLTVLPLSLHAVSNYAVPTAITAPQADDVTDEEDLGQQILLDAYKYMGRPYRYGSGGPNSFDCSGFTSFIYSHFGYTLDHSSSGQALNGRPVNGDVSQLRKGDLVFFSGRRNNSSIGHVGIFIAPDNDGESFSFIHAATHSGVIISHLSEPYYRERYRGARRVLPESAVAAPDDEPTTWHFNTEQKEEDDFPFTPEMAETKAAMTPARPVVTADEPVATPTPAETLVPVTTADEPTTTAVDEPSAPVTAAVQPTAAQRHIVLYDNGKWAWQNADGTVTQPDGTERILLAGTGDWSVPSAQTAKAAAEPAPTAEPAPAPKAKPVAPKPAAQYYKVRRGDTLSKIAANNRTTIKKLCALNGLKETSVIREGQKIRIK